MAKKIVIRRDHTFDFDGQRFMVSYGGPGFGYEVSADNEYASGTDIETHLTMAELREELQRRSDAGDPIRILLPGQRMDLAGRIWQDGTVVA